MSWKTVRGNSIALRLSALFILVALGVFLLIGSALYRQVDRSLDLLPQAELDARFSVLESTLNRFGTPEHWAKINNKLNLLSEEDKRIRFWVVSSNPAYEYGHPSELVRAFAEGAQGMRDLRLPDRPYPYKVLVSELPALGERPPLRFLIGIDTETFWQAQHSLLVAIVGLAVLGVLLASLLGYWVARIGLRPLLALSVEAQALAPPRLDGRLQTENLAPELAQFAGAFNAALDRVSQAYTRLEAFNADVAHELRSPLTNLIGQTQVALTRGRSAEHYFEVLQSNLEELERLRSIINDMLFLASADQGSKGHCPDPGLAGRGGGDHPRLPGLHSRRRAGQRERERRCPGAHRKGPAAPGADQPAEQRRAAHRTAPGDRGADRGRAGAGRHRREQPGAGDRR